MAMATLTTVTSLKQALPLEKSESSRSLSPNVTADAQHEEKNNYLRRKRGEDGEIGVFSAEKYFNGVIDAESPRLSRIVPKKHDQPNNKNEQIDFAPEKPNLNPATPSVHSVSSWNSQTALLQQNVQRKTWQRQTNKANKKIGKKFFAGLGCTCACSDKDSVDDEHVGEISFGKSKPITEENIIQKPSGLVSESSLVNGEIHFLTGNLEKPRKSLEVFGSPAQDKKSKSFRIERRLSMFSWDAHKRAEEIEYSDAPSGLINDNGSDASSSDLFEIESLKANPFLARRGSDATSGCVTPTTGYPPSEASIEWSVVTASAADFSVMSDHEELKPAPPTAKFLTSANPKTSATVKETTKLRPGILLGCNSTKAVRVAGDAQRTNDHKPNYDPRLRRVSDSWMQVTRFPPENKLVGIDSTRRQRALSTLSLSPSQPSQSSQIFYIH